jgi:hypothetical protein
MTRISRTPVRFFSLFGMVRHPCLFLIDIIIQYDAIDKIQPIVMDLFQGNLKDLGKRQDDCLTSKKIVCRDG